MLFLANYFSKQIWKPLFPRLQNSCKLRKLKSRDVFFLTTSRKFQQVVLNNDVLCVRFLMLQSTLFFSDSLSLFSERIPSIACSCYRDCLLYMLIKQAICQKCHWKWEVLAQYSTIKMKFCKTSHISLESICEGVPFK